MASIVYTQSNSPSGNQIQIYETQSSGNLIAQGAVGTGGLGSGGGLGSQSALVISDSGQTLLAVNAGSNQITTFAILGRSLKRLSIAPSGGVRPTSIATHHDLVYVMNAGGDGNVTGFRLQRDGSLAPIPNSTRALSTSASAPAQVGFNRTGDSLVVTERATNRILVFPVNGDGTLGVAVVNESAGETPFGFEFDRRDNLFVSEAFGGRPGESALSSYTLDIDANTLGAITPSAATGEAAACWVVFSRNGRFAYVTNTASGTVTGFSVGRTGELRRLGETGVTGVTRGNPLDAAVHGDSLFVVAPAIGEIVHFRIRGDGSLERVGAAFGVNSTAAGLAAS
jgi:6-phosphogluconolactonase (cycloisomerase 2 family)